MQKQTVNILTVDVEDWFHLCGVDSIVNFTNWERYESRIKNNLITLLDILAKYNVRGTFFILGWVAEKFPELVSEIEHRGHEIGTHGYAHQLVYQQSRKEFADDLEKSLQILGNVAKQKILGYRAPSFSITQDSLWALDIIAQHGLKYDSSIFPAKRGDGGLPGAQAFPHSIQLHNGYKLWEFPISIMSIFTFRLAFSGGGYFRLIPYRFIRRQIQKTNKKGEPTIVYLHPREIDINQPRLDLPWGKRFKSYINIQHTESKLKRLLNDFSFSRCKDVYNRLAEEVG